MGAIYNALLQPTSQSRELNVFSIRTAFKGIQHDWGERSSKVTGDTALIFLPTGDSWTQKIRSLFSTKTSWNPLASSLLMPSSVLTFLNILKQEHEMIKGEDNAEKCRQFCSYKNRTENGTDLEVHFLIAT